MSHRLPLSKIKMGCHIALSPCRDMWCRKALEINAETRTVLFASAHATQQIFYQAHRVPTVGKPHNRIGQFSGKTLLNLHDP